MEKLGQNTKSWLDIWGTILSAPSYGESFYKMVGGSAADAATNVKSLTDTLGSISLCLGGILDIYKAFKPADNCDLNSYNAYDVTRKFTIKFDFGEYDDYIKRSFRIESIQNVDFKKNLENFRYLENDGNQDGLNLEAKFEIKSVDNF